MHLHEVSELPSRERICADQLELLFPNKQIIRHLVLLNSMSLPINYGNEHSPHYRKVLKNATSAHQLVNAEGDDLYWTRMAYYRKSLVGAITLHIQHIQMEKGVATNPFYEVTILTLAVLPTFRRRGVASILMEETFRQCRQWGTIEISLHCQASNEAARVFYSRYNFVEVQFVPGHYANLRIAQPDAYKLKLNLPYSHNTGIDVVGSLWN